MPGANDPFLRLARTCPHCGAREPTLGTRCPRCDRSYEDRSLLDDGLIDVDDLVYSVRDGPFVGLLLELLNITIALIVGAVAGLARGARQLMRWCLRR